MPHDFENLPSSNGAINAKYQELNGDGGIAGSPTGEEQAYPDWRGTYRLYQNGTIIWTEATGAHFLGMILAQKWLDLMKKSSFTSPGYPETDETGTPDGVGRFVHCELASIHWHPSTNAHETHGAIRQKWASLGWERGILGYPTTDEIRVSDDGTACSHFQNGSVYWTPDSGAHVMQGPIQEKWQDLALKSFWLGPPFGEVINTTDGVGKYQQFRFGHIYWHPSTGAYESHGAIFARWNELGREQSYLGYPITDELAFGNARFNRFQGGAIFWTPEGEAVAVQGAGQYYVVALDKFHIHNTRSTLTDTDYASLGVYVGDQEFWPREAVKFVGNVQGGDHQLDMFCGPFYAAPGDSVRVSYLIVNKGHGNMDQNNQLIQDAVRGLAQVVDMAVPGVSIITAPLQWVLDIIFVDCDGVVATNRIGFTGAALDSLTSGHRIYTTNTFHPGTDSNIGCGSNSAYRVFWSVLRL